MTGLTRRFIGEKLIKILGRIFFCHRKKWRNSAKNGFSNFSRRRNDRIGKILDDSCSSLNSASNGRSPLAALTPRPTPYKNSKFPFHSISPPHDLKWIFFEFFSPPPCRKFSRRHFKTKKKLSKNFAKIFSIPILTKNPSAPPSHSPQTIRTFLETQLPFGQLRFGAGPLTY